MLSSTEILWAPNTKMPTDEISCQFTKAYDCVNHRIIGVTGQWFKSYLFDGKQQLEIESPDLNYRTFSHWCIIKHGVHQVLVLGSLLFLTYIIDIPATISSLYKTILFDETGIIISHPELFE